MGAGLFALVAVALYLNVRERTLLELAALQDVVVATRDILSNTVIDERNVAAARVPGNPHPAGRADVGRRRGRARGRRAAAERIAADRHEPAGGWP